MRLILFPRSLKARLLVLVLGVMVSVWVATAVMTWFDARHELDELLDGHLAQAASLLVIQQASALESRRTAETVIPTRGELDAPLLHRYAPRAAFQVYQEGVLTMRSANAPVTPMVNTALPHQNGFRTVTLNSAGGRDLTRDVRPTLWRVFAAESANRKTVVFVGERVKARADILHVVLRSTLWPMMLALPLLALAAWWAIYRGVEPLRRLGQQLSGREPQALHPVVLDNAPVEMKPLLDALNSLFGRIAELMASERRFTADAAHELRTPIAAIRIQAQVALAEPDIAARRHALHATLEGCDRATHLVEQLLTLSRLEGGAGTALATVELRALVHRTVADLALHALEKDQALELEAAAPVTVRGNATLLTVLVRNLVDNAIRYSPPGAAIHIRVAAKDAGVLLQVEDGGPGLDDAALARLGERFFRVLGSGQPGSGLGWSIVRRIAAVHDFALEPGRSPELGGLKVSLRCPSVTPPK